MPQDLSRELMYRASRVRSVVIGSDMRVRAKKQGEGITKIILGKKVKGK